MNGTIKSVGWTESGVSLKLTRSSGRKTGALWRRCQPPRPYFRENSPRAPRFAPQLPNYFTLESNQSISNKPLPFIDQWSSHSSWMAAYSFHNSDLLSCMLLMHNAESCLKLQTCFEISDILAGSCRLFLNSPFCVFSKLF